MSTEPIFMTSLVPIGDSVRVETEELGGEESLLKALKRHAAAIVFTRSFSPSPTFVVYAFKSKRTFPSSSSYSKLSCDLDRWYCYERLSVHDSWKLMRKEIVLETYAGSTIAEVSKSIETSRIKLLIRDCFKAGETQRYHSILKDVVADATCATLKPRSIQNKSKDDSNRARVQKARHAMLDKVGTFTSEELAAAGDSTSPNASQYAFDQREKGKVFGVRHGKQWLYPKFQFDAKRRVYPEIREVLKALSPDAQGWDRLQWFLEPHELLKGKTPFEVWPSNRKKVFEAAKTEQWDDRD